MRITQFHIITKYTSLLVITVCLYSGLLAQQQKYPYGLSPMNYEAYLHSVKKNPQKELINLDEYIPGLVLDIRYATKNNFTNQRMYDRARAYARKPVADALKSAQAELNKQGLGIKVFDAYRPYSVTVRFYEIYPDTTFVASPYRGSRHNRGCALDITLVKLATGEELKMPTEYDAFVREARPTFPVKDTQVRQNRDLLINVMTKYGFRVNSAEWWHFDFVGYQKYEILDVDFKELEN